MLLVANIQVLLLLWICSAIAVDAQSGTVTESINPAATNVTLAQSSAPAVASTLAGTVGNGVVSQPSLLDQIDQAIVQAVADTKNALQKILAPELYYSYGRSPPVYPSPNGIGSGGWTTAYAQAKALVSRMTNTEKAIVSLGSSQNYGCSGFVGPVSRLQFSGVCLNDAESGVRGGNLVNGFPSQLNVGASWNRTLAYARGQAIGREFKAKGINAALGPVVGPLGRIAKGGRNWEGFTNDPYLAGGLVGPTIKSMQESVIAVVKHFVANEQETNRNPFLLGLIPQLGKQAVSSNLDDRTMHELYMWPFYDAIRAEPGSVMCAYNRINGSHACQNSKLMNGLLKTELGFQGFVVSDWGATHTGIASNNAGLDMVMPQSSQLTPSSLSFAVLNGSIKSSRLDDQATRIIASWYRYAQIPNIGVDSNKNIDARDPAASNVLLQAAVEGHVLVKNINNALPLRAPSTLNLFGYDAVGGLNGTSGLGSGGLANTQTFTDGRPFTSLEYISFVTAFAPDSFNAPTVALNGTLLSGGGSGSITPSSSTSPFDAFRRQAAMDNTTLHYDFVSTSPLVQEPNKPCIVFINAQSVEGSDRSALSDDYSDNLVRSVASQCSNTIVNIHNAGIRIVDSWIDHPNITAVIFAHTPGQESGNALIEIMYGKQSPSGRLPYTVAKQESDYGALLGPSYADANNPLYPQSDFSEGLNIDYKHFISQGITPRFAFGYGLTYSTFNYSSLQVTKQAGAIISATPPDANSRGPIPQGGLNSLYDIIATITIQVTNTGKVSAAEVAQLYVGIPGSGQPKVLRGFEKQLIQPGNSATYSFPLRRRDLSIWDTGAQQWRLPSGTFALNVGKSVLDIQLQGTLQL
ncbi:putative beta-glucosidase [Aureobasidium pullulans]|nr:putative beta-glucosidase [Aureobasidium pullulans]